MPADPARYSSVPYPSTTAEPAPSTLPALCGTHRLAAYELTYRNDDFCVTRSFGGASFSLTGYSRFKYGDSREAARFASVISAMLAQHLAPIQGTEERVVICGTPYKRVQNAARLLAANVEHDLHHAGFPIGYASIHQQRLASGDYGTLNQAQRDARNQQKMRTFDPDDFAHKHVIIIDDVCITGSIERSVIALLADVPMLSLTIANLVRMDPVAVATDPTVENKLNHGAITRLDDLWNLMCTEPSYVLTTRAVKYILEAPPEAVAKLVAAMDYASVNALYHGALDDGYAAMPEYRYTFQLVSDAYRARKAEH